MACNGEFTNDYTCGGSALCCLPGDGGVVSQCEQKGGACVALVPGACVNSGDPAQYSCGSGLGVQCCLDGIGDGGPAPTQCAQEGGECIGLSPQGCAGGTTEAGKCGPGVGVTCCKRP